MSNHEILTTYIQELEKDNTNNIDLLKIGHTSNKVVEIILNIMDDIDYKDNLYLFFKNSDDWLNKIYKEFEVTTDKEKKHLFLLSSFAYYS